MNTENRRILAEGFEVVNDTYQTNLNNNDLIVGPSGAGKTTGYVIPNIARCNSSYIIADTKGNLAHKLTPLLKSNGYDIITIDFIDVVKSERYNPLSMIGKESAFQQEKDIVSLANILCPIGKSDDPFWEESAQDFITCGIAYVTEMLPAEEQNFSSVFEIVKRIGTEEGDRLFRVLNSRKPDSLAAKKYRALRIASDSPKTLGCIMLFVNRALNLFDLSVVQEKFCTDSDFQFEQLGKHPTAMFINISDIDRSFDKLINVFYTQAFQFLCRAADKEPDSRLKVPVRIILDDFATNTYIPYFDNIMSVIRSREIYASIILQSISQLRSLYSEAAALTIINNCDHLLYLGGLDLDTAEYIANRSNKPQETILCMPLDKAYVFERGSVPFYGNKIKPEYSVKLLEKYSAPQPQKASDGKEILL